MATYKSQYTGQEIDAGIAKANTAIQDVSDKQDILVSGTNIKTINGQSILGSGNIEIGGDIPTPVGSYSISYALTNCSSSNTSNVITEGNVYSTILSVLDSSYILGAPVITMGGTDITSTVWNSDTSMIMIPSVNGDIVITCVATENVDTSAAIAQYDVGFNTTGGTKAFTGLCVTEKYSNTYDIDKIHASSYYDSTNNYMTVSGGLGTVVYYTPKTNFTAKYGDVSGLTPATKIVDYDDNGTMITYYSNGSYTTSTAGTAATARQKTAYLTSTRVDRAFTLFTDDLDDSYAYWTRAQSGDENYVLPEGVREGDIIFAGKNTQYYGLANIDGTRKGEDSVSTLSVDNDYAKNFRLATTSVLGEDVKTTSAYEEKILEAKKAWMIEYGGDFNKIPIIIHTDQHGRLNGKKAFFDFLNSTVNWYSVSKIMNLGDTVSVAWMDADKEHPLLRDEALENALKAMEKIPYSKRLDVFGNHDTWYGNYNEPDNPIGTRYPSSQAHLEQYFRNIYARRTNNNGWFVEYDDRFNIKYIVISDFEYKNDSVQFRVGTEQMTWLIEEMSKNDGYDIVIVSHVPLKTDNDEFIYPTGQTSSEKSRIISGVDTDAFFAARKTKGSGTIEDSDGVSHNYDFTNCNTKLLCSLHGHTHYDAYLYLNNSLLVNAFDWFDDDTFFFVLIDRTNEELNVWKVSNPSGGAMVQNYQIPFNPEINAQTR